MEYLGLYDENGNYTGGKIERSRKKEVPKGRYFRIVIIFIQNDKGEFLIQKVAKEKGGEYATTGGHVQNGISSIETVKQEIWEELGINIAQNEITLFEIKKHPLAYQDCYYTQKNIDIDDLKLQKEEVETVEWMTIDHIKSLISLGIFRKGNIAPFLNLVDILSNEKDMTKLLYKMSDNSNKKKYKTVASYLSLKKNL